MKQGDTNAQETNNEPEQTKEELEAEFDPNDKGIEIFSLLLLLLLFYKKKIE